MFNKKIYYLILIICYISSYSSGNNKLYSSVCDINGDSIVDSFEVRKIKHIDCENKKCVCVNLWNKEEKFLPDTQIIINFLISNGKGNKYKRYIIFNKNFFSTPIWQEQKVPVSILKYKNKSLLEKKCQLSPVGDIVVLGTESGIDVYLFFDGKDIRLCEPIEEP